MGYQEIQGSSIDDDENKPIFLPLVINGEKVEQSLPVYGTEIINPNNANTMQKAEEVGTYWVRYLAFNWSNIEPIRSDPPTYKWDVVNETALQNINNQNLSTLAIIYNTPTWAQKISGKTCSPIAQEDFEAFSQFIKALVTRYGFSDYQVKYWEFINEPDAAWTAVGYESFFGCWGDSSDLEYYGGDDYAQMLKVGYQAVKSIDPNGQVVLGGLLLDCDPDQPILGKYCPQGNFLKGVMSNGGGDYFDIANFHAYPYQNDDGKIVDETHQYWAHRGGILKGKAAFVKEVMENYGYSKPIFNSETALTCPEWSDCLYDLESFYENQASYVPRLYSISKTLGLLGSIWYHLEGPGWRYSGLLNSDGSPKPAFNACKFMTAEMKSTTALGESFDFSGVTTHKFSSQTKEIWVMWSSDQENTTVTLPSEITRIFDKYGNEKQITNPMIINEPIYVEIQK